MFVFVVLLVYDIVVNIVLKKVNLSWNELNCKGVLVLIRTDSKVLGTGALVGFVLDSEAVVVVVGDLAGNDPSSEFVACFIMSVKL